MTPIAEIDRIARGIGRPEVRGQTTEVSRKAEIPLIREPWVRSTDFRLTFYQLIIDELICIRLKPEIAAKWTIQGNDYENDQPDEECQQHHLNSL